MARKFFCGPIVETNEGKLRGFELDGVYHFYGIKYVRQSAGSNQLRLSPGKE